MKAAATIGPRPWMRAREVRAVMAALAADGTVVRLVGGCVRDAVLDRPATDFDFATPEPPEQVTARLADAGITALPTGIAHGTVTAVIGDWQAQITTLRRDVETDGRHARVAFTDDWEADAQRRDLTLDERVGRPGVLACQVRYAHVRASWSCPVSSSTPARRASARRPHTPPPTLRAMASSKPNFGDQPSES